MFVIVQHTVTDLGTFWNSADPTALPPHVKLHHTFPAPDGRRAVCVWEAESVEALRGFLEPVVGGASRNEYFEVENRDGIAMPSGVARRERATT